eukprot:12668370-Ditylum_brightwellii.AAC.1
MSISAILYATPPSLGSCVARQWIATLGFSLELVPIIVKVAAINRLFSQSKKMKRVKINQKHLYTCVAAVIVIVAIYLSVWTAADPPTRQSDSKLTEKNNGRG